MKQIFTAVLCAVAAICATVQSATAQPRLQKVQIILVPGSSNAVYETGEKATMKVMALHQGVALENATI